MYSKIWSPYKQEFVSTFSIEGKKVIKAYVNSYMTGGASQNKKVDALKKAALKAAAAAVSIDNVIKNIGKPGGLKEAVNKMNEQICSDKNSLAATLKAVDAAYGEQ
jgi:hypothetical protein